MKSAILSVLESLVRTFTDHKFEFDVRESSKGVFHLRDKTIYADLNLRKFGFNEFERLRVIVDALNHLCEHVNLGYAKETLDDFIEKTGMGDLSRWILTIVEDQYTDFSRLKKWRGLKKTRALFAKRIIEIEPSVHRIKSEREAALRGFWTIGYTGFAKGEKNAPKRLREFFDYAREILRDVRRIHDFEKREEVARDVLREIVRFNGKISGELDPKIDFETRASEREFFRLDISADECDLDLSGIFEWNDLKETDLGPSEFEKTLLESIRSLQIELDREQRMKVKTARFVRTSQRKIEVPENLIKEVTMILEKIKTEDAFVESEWGESINLKNYVRYFCGESVSHLYYETKPADTGGRAVLLAVDLSGSMRTKIRETIIASQILIYAAEYLNDKVAAFGFQEKPGIGAFVRIIPIKLWNEKFDPRNFDIETFGNTPLREAVIEAGEWLSYIPSRKKVAFVFTDAEPTSSTPEQVYRTVCGLRCTGIDVVGVGVRSSINPSMLNQCFGEGYIWVPEIRELPYALFRAYTSLINRRVDLFTL